MSAALQRIREHEQRQEAARELDLRLSGIETESLRRERASIARRDALVPLSRDEALKRSPFLNDAKAMFALADREQRRWWEFWKR